MAEAAILGISPGTKYCGVVVLHHGELLVSKVTSFKGAWSEEKLDKIASHVFTLVKKHAIAHIACKVHHASRTSLQVESILLKIKEMAKAIEIEVYTYTIGELKGLFKMNFHSAHVLSEHIVRRFPELTDVFFQERKNKNKYHYKLFEALAAGLMCHSTLV
jgi:hypothetical protein